MSKSTWADFGFKWPPQPYWLASASSTDYPKVDVDVKVDVAIVGGGLVGITTAYLLKREGLSVAVMEAGRILHGTTGHTTAKITSQHGLTYHKLIQHVGVEKARQYAEANQFAIKLIHKIVMEERIDCDFSWQPAYMYTQADNYVSQIEDEITAAVSLGIKAEYVKEIALPIAIKAAEKFTDQAQFHPVKYLLALASRIPGHGSHVFERSRVVDFHEGRPSSVITDEGKKVFAEHIVIASHFPAYGSNGYYFARMYPERSYLLGVHIKGEFPGGMYITAEDPGRSLRATPSEDGELVLIGGEHHKPGQGPNTNTHYENLIEFARSTFDVTDIPFRWSAQDYTTLDDIPYVGKITSGSPNVFVATGFRKWGMTNGTASAAILRDLIVRGESLWAPVFNPSRFEADPMVKNLVSTNLYVAKHLVGDKLRSVPADVEIAPGEAQVVSREGDKIGLYKDDQGKVHAMDVTCTHMGCELLWNAAERSWDCPCHGSRFTYDGNIIEGPALKSLRTDEGRFNP